MQIPDEHREFLEAHRLCVVGVGRGDDAPSLSPVYYVMDGDDILISTTSSRYKGRAASRGAPIALCVLHEQMPFSYVTVYGRASVDDEGAPELMARIGEVMSGRTIPAEAMPMLRERAQQEGRVVLRVTPERFVSTAPRARQEGS